MFDEIKVGKFVLANVAVTEALKGEVIWSGCPSLADSSPTGFHLLNDPTPPNAIVV